MKLFPPGKKITVDDTVYTVENVCVRGTVLMVKFKELTYSIDSEQINCSLDEVDFNRTVD